MRSVGYGRRKGLGTPRGRVGYGTTGEQLRVRHSSPAGGGGRECEFYPGAGWGRGQAEGRGFAHQGPGGALTVSPGRKSHGTPPPRPAPHLTSPPPPPGPGAAISAGPRSGGLRAAGGTRDPRLLRREGTRGSAASEGDPGRAAGETGPRGAPGPSRERQPDGASVSPARGPAGPGRSSGRGRAPPPPPPRRPPARPPHARAGPAPAYQWAHAARIRIRPARALRAKHAQARRGAGAAGPRRAGCRPPEPPGPGTRPPSPARSPVPRVAACPSPGLDSEGRGTGRGPHAMVCPGTSPSPWGGALCPGPQISAATTSSLNPSARTRPPTQGPAPPPRTHPGQTRRSGPGVLDPDPRERGARSIRYQFLQVWRPGFPYPPGTRAPGPPQPGVQTPLLLRTQTSCAPSPNPGVRGRSDHPGAWSSGRLSLRDPGVPRAPSPAGGVPHPQDPSLLTWLRGGFRARRGAGPAAQRGDPIGPGAGPAGAGCGSRLSALGAHRGLADLETRGQRRGRGGARQSPAHRGPAPWSSPTPAPLAFPGVGVASNGGFGPLPPEREPRVSGGNTVVRALSIDSTGGASARAPQGEPGSQQPPLTRRAPRTRAPCRGGDPGVRARSRTQIQAFDTLMSQEGTSGVSTPAPQPTLLFWGQAWHRTSQGPGPGHRGTSEVRILGSPLYHPLPPGDGNPHIRAPHWIISGDSGPRQALSTRVGESTSFPPKPLQQPGSGLQALKRSQETPVQRMKWGGSLRRGRQAGAGPGQGPFPCWADGDRGTHLEPWLMGSPLNALTVTRADLGASACVLLILSPGPGSELGCY